MLCVQVEQNVDTVRIRILSWRAKGKRDGSTGLTFRRILATRSALFSKYHLYPQSQLTLFISYNCWCFKLNADKNNLLLFLIFTCALLRVTRHFLTFLYFWRKNCLKHIVRTQAYFSSLFSLVQMQGLEKVSQSQVFLMRRYSTKCNRLLSLKRFVHLKRATGHGCSTTEYPSHYSNSTPNVAQYILQLLHTTNFIQIIL